MSDKSTIKCPNCQRELKWIPKGKHLCSCGETIKSSGEGLKELNFAEYKIPLKEKLPSFFELQIIFATLLIIGMFAAKVLYQEKWLHYEAELMSNLFGIDPTGYKVIVLPLVMAVILICWLAHRITSKFKKTQRLH